MMKSAMWLPTAFFVLKTATATRQCAKGDSEVSKCNDPAHGGLCPCGGVPNNDTPADAALNACNQRAERLKAQWQLGVEQYQRMIKERDTRIERLEAALRELAELIAKHTNHPEIVEALHAALEPEK